MFQSPSFGMEQGFPFLQQFSSLSHSPAFEKLLSLPLQNVLEVYPWHTPAFSGTRSMRWRQDGLGHKSNLVCVPVQSLLSPNPHLPLIVGLSTDREALMAPRDPFDWHPL